MKTAARWITYCVLAAAIGAFLTFAAPLVTSIRWTLSDAAMIGLAAATLGAIWVGHEWHRIGQELDAINHTFDTQQVERAIPYVCCARGHNVRFHIVSGVRVWICTECPATYLSESGWVDGGAA